MTHSRKTYAYDHAGKQFIFNGHIKKETAQKRQFKSVTLAILDFSGKGRGESRRFYGPNFDNMKGYN